jgi:hypothetical protein
VIHDRNGRPVDPASFSARLTPEARTAWLRALSDRDRKAWLMGFATRAEQQAHERRMLQVYLGRLREADTPDVFDVVTGARRDPDGVPSPAWVEDVA